MSRAQMGVASACGSNPLKGRSYDPDVQVGLGNEVRYAGGAIPSSGSNQQVSE
jgi:hypothetical protein